MSKLRWGLIDREGTQIVPCVYDFLWWPSDRGVFPAKLNNVWTFRDFSGALALEGEFEDACTHEECRAPVKVNGKYGFIDQDGTRVSTFQFDHLGQLRGGIATAKDGRLFGFVNKNAELVTPCHFAHVDGFDEGYGRACFQDMKWGYIDARGQTVIGHRFEEAGYFAEGLAHVTQGKLHGYIDRAGEFVLKSDEWTSGGIFSDGLASVMVWNEYEWKAGYLNRQGEMVIPPVYDFAGAFCEGRGCVEIDKKRGAIDTAGNLVVEPRYHDDFQFHEGLAETRPTANSQYGYIGLNGEQVIPPQFDHATSFRNGYARVAMRA